LNGSIAPLIEKPFSRIKSYRASDVEIIFPTQHNTNSSAIKNGSNKKRKIMLAKEI
jgi:hypothetical protein